MTSKKEKKREKTKTIKVFRFKIRRKKNLKNIIYKLPKI